ncbi:MAG: trypsin-like peptidase domain-containing protein [Calditrichaeota bacterium]|nr:trypsin-like peptidase domain-containing protein [Calditrichota bacterium]
MILNPSGDHVKTLKQIFLFMCLGFLIGIAYLYLTDNLAINFLIGDSVSEKNKTTKPTAVYKSALTTDPDQLTDANLNISNSRHNAITEAIQKATPAVVSINVKSLQYRRPTSIFDMFERRPQVVQSVGSGFVISPDGFVVTNQHVIDNANEITVIMPNGDKFAAKKIGEDVQSDIALIKLQDVNIELPTVEFGNSDDLIIGEWAIAIGNPFGLNEINNSPTVTLGIISAINRDFGHISGEEKVYHEMIQTDASINSGNSGGPLVNALGQVIGMNTIIYTGGSGSGSVGLAFSIPSKRIMEMVDVLKTGDIDRNVYTGIGQVFQIDARVAYNYELGISYGVLIRTLYQNSPAHLSGLKPGDIIIEANGVKIKNITDLSEAIKFSGLKVGDKLDLKVVRGKETLDFKLVLGRAPN